MKSPAITEPSGLPPTPTISPTEWRWLQIASVLTLLLLTLPTALGFLNSSPTAHFSGLTLGADDGFSYLAKLRTGADGAWLFQNVYAVEPHSPGLVYLHYMWLGKLTGGSPIGAVFVYHALRLIGAAAYLWLAYPLAALLLSHVWQRQLAWLLIHFGGGLGLLLVIFTGQPLPFGNAPFELYLNEAFSLHMLLALPHTAPARAALIGGLLLFLAAIRENNRGKLAASAGLWLLASLLLPLEILTAGASVGGLVLSQLVVTRRLPRTTIAYGWVAGLPGGVYVAAAFALSLRDPVYAAWNAQNSLPLPHPLHWLVAYGVLLGLALVGLRAAYQHPAGRFLMGWAALNALLPLLPFSFQLRLIEGLSLPLTILAVFGLGHFSQTWRSPWPIVARASLLMLMLPGSLLLYLGAVFQAQTQAEAVFLSADEWAAFAWLNDNAPPGSILLSSERVGVRAPAYASLRVLLGHGFETPNFAEKAQLVAQFYRAPRTSPLLSQYVVDYVWWGSAERELGAGDLTQHPNLTPVFTHGEITLFATTPP